MKGKEGFICDENILPTIEINIKDAMLQAANALAIWCTFVDETMSLVALRKGPFS